MRILIAIACLSRIIIIYCIFLSNNNGILTTYDSKGYVDSALSILELKSFAVSPQQPEEPQLYRTPGYPLFIAAIYFLFGKNNLIINISQNILSLISILVIAHLCYTLLSELNYITIFTLLVLDIFSMVMSNFLLSEILFTFFLILSFYLIVYVICNNNFSYLRLSLVGLLMSFTTMVRPLTYYLFYLIIIVFLILFILRRFTLKQILVNLIIILLPWAFIIGGWQIRNYYVAGITNLTTVENHNLLYYRCAGILSLTNNISFEKAQEDITNNLQIKYNIRKLSISQINKIKYNEALLYFFNNKLAFLLMMLKSMIILMISPGINTVKDHISIELLHRTLAVLSTCYLLIIYSCILFYFISLFTKKYKPTILDLFCFIFILYILIISAGPEGCSRFRVPIMPLLAISSGIGFSNLISLFPNNGKRIY